MPSSADRCDRTGCSKELDGGVYQLPEDRRMPEPPQFCSSACAATERMQRNWKSRLTAFDTGRATL